MITEELSFEDYRKNDAINPSLLVHALHSWKQFRHVQENGFIPKTDTRTGTLLHDMVEGGQSVIENYAVMPDFKNHRDNVTGTGSPSTSKTAWVKEQEAAFIANAEKEIVTKDSFVRAERMLEALNGHKEVVSLIRGSRHEISIGAELCGVKCKGRVDGINGSVLWDTKSSQDIRAHQFGRTAANLKYVFKMSFYWRLLYQLGIPIDRVVLVAVQDSKPRKDGGYNEAPDCCLYEIPLVAIENQQKEIDRLLDGYKACLDCDIWPGIQGGQLVIPNWAMEDQDLVE